jgi:Fe-S cluster biosynthesis and repair protein YggX
VPEFKAAAPAAPQQVGEGEVMCKRCGKLGPKMKAPPFKNEFGKRIFENTCAPCWQEAIRMGTKVINELRLDLSDPRAQKAWDTNIREFLNLS